MKKTIFSFVFITFFAPAVFSQTVFGINFGYSYETVKEKLESRFGKYKVIENGGNLEVVSPVMGGIEFDLADFYFQRGTATSWLSRVYIQKHFELNDLQYAKRVRQSVADILNEKYIVEDYVNNQGFKSYCFGTNPKDNKEPLGFLYLQKSEGKDNKTRYYLILEYGPIYYIDKSSDF